MAAIHPTDTIWFDGELVPWHAARVHVLTHALHYGSAVFEGIRAYRAKHGTAIFRLTDHLHRLLDSARIYRLDVPFDLGTLHAACREVVRANRLEAAYLRPLVFRGYGSIGVLPDPELPVQVAIAAFPWGGHLGQQAKRDGVDVAIASWNRIAPNTLPALAKCAANYASSQLVAMEARRHGYHAALVLDRAGHLSEGAGENVFVVRRGVLYTPPLGASILGGITRDTVLHLAREQGLEHREESIPREMVHVADELFFAGTAAEITPIRAVDGLPVGAGCPGPVTADLQRAFDGLCTGELPDPHGWLEPV